MVTITGFQKRKKANGESFNVLNLMSGVEVIKSNVSGKPYLSARKANVICHFDDATCLSLVNTKLPGTIEKQECDPYDFKVPQSDEVIQLDYTYVYNPEPANVEESVFETAGNSLN